MSAAAKYRAACKVTIGRVQLASADASAIASLVIERAKHGGAGEAAIVLGSGFAGRVALDDAVSIELGFGDALERVFTGRAVAVEPRLDFGASRLVVRAHDDLARLMHAPRQPRLFENHSAGDIVKAHAADAGLALGQVAAGERIARAYLHRESPYEHCRALAARAGFDLYISEHGKLMFGPFERRAADHVLQHGRDLIAVQRRAVAAPAGFTVVPESPASSAGDDTVAWLVKDASAHAATVGDADVRTLSDPLLRTRDAAQAAARAYAGARWRRGTATALLPGRAGAQLGQAVELKGLPENGLDGLYELLGLTHRLDPARGFLTRFTLAAID